MNSNKVKTNNLWILFYTSSIRIGEPGNACRNWISGIIRSWQLTGVHEDLPLSWFSYSLFCVLCFIYFSPYSYFPIFFGFPCFFLRTPFISFQIICFFSAAKRRYFMPVIDLLNILDKLKSDYSISFKTEKSNF